MFAYCPLGASAALGCMGLGGRRVPQGEGCGVRGAGCGVRGAGCGVHGASGRVGSGSRCAQPRRRACTPPQSASAARRQSRRRTDRPPPDCSRPRARDWGTRPQGRRPSPRRAARARWRTQSACAATRAASGWASEGAPRVGDEYSRRICRLSLAGRRRMAWVGRGVLWERTHAAHDGGAHRADADEAIADRRSGGRGHGQEEEVHEGWKNAVHARAPVANANQARWGEARAACGRRVRDGATCVMTRCRGWWRGLDKDLTSTSAAPSSHPHGWPRVVSAI